METELKPGFEAESTGLLSPQASSKEPGLAQKFWEKFCRCRSGDLEDRTIIEYRSSLSECWGHTW